jgi:uncharacterized protein YprB with RNaseH-like and TPR domain
VRAALAKVSIKQVESARSTALKRSVEADDSQTADLFRRIADDMEAELFDRLLTIATRDVLRASQEATRDAKALLTQFSS